MSLIRQISRRAVVLQNTEAEVATSKTISPYYEWVFNGELNFPIEAALDTLHHTDSQNTIYQVRVTARTSGDSTYRIKIISYDLLGLNPITHVDRPVQFTTDRRTAMLVVDDALIPENRAIEARVFEELVGINPAKDVTLSLTMGTFEETMPLTNGHLIQRDDNTVLPKREKLKFAGDAFDVSDDLPNDRTVVELTRQALIDLVYPIGAYLEADITEVQFQAEMGSGWVLADGRSSVGTAYETLTGKVNIPDVRGTYKRMKDNGAGLDPNGDPTLGSYQADVFASHNHSTTAPIKWGSQTADPIGWSIDPGLLGTGTIATNAVGGNETRPKSTIVNVFIKIN